MMGIYIESKVGRIIYNRGIHIFQDVNMEKSDTNCENQVIIISPVKNIIFFPKRKKR